MSAQLEIANLSQALSLANEPQDWGIVNANPERAEEFMLYSQRNQLSLAQQYVMVELVIASINEAILSGSFTKEMYCQFSEFLKSELHGLPDQINYWKRLSNASEFPVSKLLDSLHPGQMKREHC